MTRDFQQIDWCEQVEQDCRALVCLAVREDLGQGQDWTTQALVSPDMQGSADIVTRQAGVVAGIPALETTLDEMNAQITLAPAVQDGEFLGPDTVVATLAGSVQNLLTSERILLNLLGRLMGIATLTHQFVEAVSGTGTQVYDTRKTTPGWRRLEKYAVRCGGGHNHRTGLFDAILIKDNHLAFLNSSGVNSLRPDELDSCPAVAIRQVRDFLTQDSARQCPIHCLIEVEVDTIEQLSIVLPAGPDIVLLDNMPLPVLREAVCLRNARAPQVQLEASGGIDLRQIREVAKTGVERVSVGALTHSAQSLDIGLDWRRTGYDRD